MTLLVLGDLGHCDPLAVVCPLIYAEAGSLSTDDLAVMRHAMEVIGALPPATRSRTGESSMRQNSTTRRRPG